MYCADLSPDAYPTAEDGDVFTEVGTGVRFVTVRDAAAGSTSAGWRPDGPGPRGRRPRSSPDVTKSY
ncbi:hypothetical protein ACGF1Z_10355 [Streptomyces sp. NPDC048018]|uniref:hypothetical protein n=1 Tax=Streptomyces sp. NPDC048018 TaxID=3365499 RepID=UPI00371C89C7